MTVARIAAHVQGLADHRILRNITWLSLSYGIAKPLWFAFITAGCMRILPPEGYGVFTTSLVLAMMASTVADLGTTEYTTRAVSRRPQEASRLMTNILVARVALAVVGVLAAFFAGMVLGYARTHLAAVVAAGAYAVAFRGAEYCRAFYRAFEVLKHEAVFTVIEKGSVVGFGFAALLWFSTPVMAFVGMAIGMLAVFTANVWWVNRHFAALRLQMLSHRFIVKTLRSAAPIGLIALFSTVPLAVGPLAVDRLISTEAAGIFGAAQRVVEALMLATSVIAIVLFPRLSALFHRNERRTFWRLLKRSLVAVSAMSVLVAVLLTFLAPIAIAALAGDDRYAEAGALLAVFGWVFPVMSITFISVMALIAADAHRAAAIASGGAAVLSIVLTFLLIPVWGLHGPIAALFLTWLLLSYVNISACHRLVGQP